MFRALLGLLSFFALIASAYAGESPFRRSVRASAIDPQARSHPAIGFVLEKDGKPQDLEHASVDLRVPSQGKLVIWLMAYNGALFDRLDGYGLHSIQVCYPREWFAKLYAGPPPADDLFLSKIRLEAATGRDLSPQLDIGPPDSIMGRSRALVKWLAAEHPAGGWSHFLNDDGSDLRWDRVILAGASHGATTAARMAKEIAVDRVVMFCGPRDPFEVWQKLPSATEPRRFFGFSHTLDEGWQGDHYPRSWQLMGLQAFGPVVNVDEVPPPYRYSRRLITSADVDGDANRAHSSVTPGSAAVKGPDGGLLHEAVWRYLFLHPVELTGEPVAADPDVWIDQRQPKPGSSAKPSKASSR